MPKKCGAKTKDGGACKAWAMSNGFCRRHGGEFTGSQVPPRSEKGKPIVEKCGVITGRGKPCKLPAVVNGRCRMHQSNPAASQKPPKPKKEKAKRKERESKTTIEELLATWLCLTVCLIAAVGEAVMDLLCTKDSSSRKKKKQ